MHPTSSFLGKCVTVLIGIGLSWVSITNPQAIQVADTLVGSGLLKSERSGGESVKPLEIQLNTQQQDETKPQSEAAEETHAEEKNGLPSKFAAPLNVAVQPKTESQHIAAISDRLKELGATYLRLERLANPRGTWFRVRCDLPAEHVKCCLESTRESATAALEDVLHAARAAVQGPVASKVVMSR